MKNINELIEELHLDTRLSLEDIPDLDLYMDQVIQLFEKRFSATKRNENDKVLTKTMINNYSKGKLFFPIENKKYSKDHLILISLIYQMKGALSINDVKQTLDKLNTKMMDNEFDLRNLYSSYLQLLDINIEMFKKDLQEHKKEVTKKVVKLEDKDEEYLEQFLLAATFTSMSNFYRRAAENIIDELGTTDKDDQ
ncbi:hypothetical protein CIL05_15150 [Virgibacillus profundi]|uniref:Cytoplasmic protein n=1 Tax=Virgibacillus profundi TaxID=2024555 RepID=A0A2A2IBX7_9BACI|nr:DUF1836 domain-containing protein [Virgibacillus profundi]PAV28630.1 hypothetical protein CIL05_15150 [Virgibacillus profundi]PXY52798.1 DUF1836 domain-containing protein [Virgibacillus profundi]